MEINKNTLITVLENKLKTLDNKKEININMDEIESLRVMVITEAEKVTNDYYKDIKDLKTMESLLSQIKSKMI